MKLPILLLLALPALHCIYVGDKFPKTASSENSAAGGSAQLITNNGVKQWAVLDGVAAKNTSGVATATDSTGNVFVTGSTAGGGGLGGQGGVSSAGDTFIAKYDTNGTPLWTRLFGAAPNSLSTPSGICTDSSGNAYITGVSLGDFQGQIKTGAQDTFVMKVNGSGTMAWARMRGVAGQIMPGNGLACDSAGNTYIVATLNGTGLTLDSYTSVGSQDLILLKYDTAGNWLWTQGEGVVGNATVGSGVTIDAAGNIYATGSTRGALNGETYTGGGGDNPFIIKYDSAGSRQWTRLSSLTATASANAIAVDAAGYPAMTGSTTGNMDGVALTGSTDVFVSKYSPAGVRQWTSLSGVSPANTQGTGIIADAANNVYAAGSTAGNLGGNTKAGAQDLFVQRYDSTGALQWTRLLGKTGSTIQTKGAAYHASGALYVTGSANLGIDTANSIGSMDYFVTAYR